MKQRKGEEIITGGIVVGASRHKWLRQGGTMRKQSQHASIRAHEA